VAHTKALELSAKPLAEMTHEEYREVLHRAKKGDKVALALAKQMFDLMPEWEASLGDLERTVEATMLTRMTGDDLLSHEVYTRRLARLRSDLAGPSPSPLERALVGRIAACWLQVQYADYRVAVAEHESITLTLGVYHRDRQDRAHKRYLSAIKALAVVRRLQLPALQVNIGAQQLNVAAALD
jgi:hypothetical protein